MVWIGEVDAIPIGEHAHTDTQPLVCMCTYHSEPHGRVEVKEGMYMPISYECVWARPTHVLLRAPSLRCSQATACARCQGVKYGSMGVSTEMIVGRVKAPRPVRQAYVLRSTLCQLIMVCSSVPVTICRLHRGQLSMFPVQAF